MSRRGISVGEGGKREYWRDLKKTKIHYVYKSILPQLWKISSKTEHNLKTLMHEIYTSGRRNQELLSKLT